jgi:hypothetical protein
MRTDWPEDDGSRPDDGSRRDSGDAPVTGGADANREGSADAVRGGPAVGPDAGKRTARDLEYRAAVDAVYRAHAIDQGYERVREIEEKTVTPAMRRIEAEDSGRHLAGLEHRLKGKDRLTEKVTFDIAKKGVTVEQALGNVKDAIRSTFCYPEDRYAEGVYADCGRLGAEGFRLVERRNSWDKEQYKGINSRWRVPGSGQLFEVQFHTQASLDAKEETHWAYEKLRVGVPTAAEQKELEDYQKRITARLPIPPGAPDIPDYP